MRILRHITGRTRVPREGYSPSSDAALRAQYGVEAIPSRMRRRRLTYLASLINTPQKDLEALTRLKMLANS